MKYLISVLALAVCVVGCDNKPSFAIHSDDTNSQYANNSYFKQVDKRAYTYYFKGSPSTYYGINLQGKDVFSGYLVFMGPNPPLCFSRLNFKGRKTFNDLLKALKEKQFITPNTMANESFGSIGYYTNSSANQNNAIYINYNTDFGFGYLTIQSSGCMKAMFQK